MKIFFNTQTPDLGVQRGRRNIQKTGRSARTRNVLLSFYQRWQCERQHIQTIEQIAPKPARQHLFLKTAIGGRNDSDVDRNNFFSSYASSRGRRSNAWEERPSSVPMCVSSLPRIASSGRKYRLKDFAVTSITG